MRSIRSIRLTAVIAAALCLNACAWLDVRAREMVYRPTPGLMADWQALTPRDEAIWIDQPAVSGARLRAIWIPQADPAAPAVLYLHGTFRNVIQNRPKIEPIVAAGFSVLAVDYRGWGESSAVVPSEPSIVEDGVAAWRAFERLAPIAGSRVIYGHSMGSGVAVELARRYQGDPAAPAIGALVLESAFTSMPDVARDYNWFAGWLARLGDEEFRSIDKIGAIRVPIWLVSGSADQTVPSSHAVRLREAAGPGERHLIILDGGGHSRLQDQFPARYRAFWDEVRHRVTRDLPPGVGSAPVAPH